MVKFGYTILYVEDVKKTITFYEEAFGFKRKFIAPDNDYGELDTGATTLSFAAKTLGNSNLKNGFIESDLTNKPFAIELGLVTENVEETIQKAQKVGAMLLEVPKQKPWGQTVAYLRDMDGFLIEVCTPVGK